MRHAEDNKPIDFVVTWVDGNDPAWREEFNRYAELDGDASAERFRDWNLLRYWFRGIEECTPWVNKVHFVTWGHLPEWINLANPKLNIVKHEDYIPKEYLPTFSSHTIEWNVHRIKGLSEDFVLFNDDTYMIRPAARSDFFKNGLPCDTAVLQPTRTTRAGLFYVAMTNAAVLSDHYSAREAVLKHPLKWFNPRYGLYSLRTLLMLPYPHFYGFRHFHLPNSFKKKTFEELWEAEGNLLAEVCSHRFRVTTDVNQWLAQGWQFAKGEFYPRSPSIGRVFHLGEGCDEMLSAIDCYMNEGKGSMLCINDGNLSADEYDRSYCRMHQIFEKLFPHSSSFEVD